MRERMLALILAVVALVGVAHVALLPPWEGYDEIAHWSSIQQIADRGETPIYGRDSISADVAAYRGPAPYGAVWNSLTYERFRRSGATALGAGPTHYAPGATLNWEAQQPPLYYVLLAPAYRAFAGLGWVDHLLALRLVSWALAFAGLAIAAFGLARLGPAFVAPAYATAAWPLLVPEFFPDMARLGNDTLSLFMFAAVWVLLIRQLAPGSSVKGAVALGATLGLGLLTKAFFVPIGAGVGAVLLWAAWLKRSRSDGMNAVVAGGVALAIGGWWYLSNLLHSGSAIGADEFIRLKQNGGLLAGLAAHFSVAAFVKGLLGFALSFVWAGTWSFVQPPAWAQAPIYLLVVAPLLIWLWRLPRSPAPVVAPIFVLAPLVAGLVYHILITIALVGDGAGTPGWYLHILAPALACAWASVWRWSRWQGALMGLTALYTVFAWFVQASVFSGCTHGDAAGGTGHALLGVSGCLLNGGQLGLLARPTLAVAALIVAAMFAAVVILRRSPRPQI